jgi:RNA polymerase sigma-70 factor (ECF subfamily)
VAFITDLGGSGWEQPVAAAAGAGAVGATIKAGVDAGVDASLQQMSERQVIEQAQAGDRAAFDELVRRYDRDVLRLAVNVLHSTEDARDVYQEAFLKIYRNLHRFRSECSFYTWIYRIVTNVCLDHLRRRRSRPEDQAPELAMAAREGAAGPDFFERQRATRAQDNPESNLLGQEIGVRIERALAMLSPRERMIFEMKHYQGLKLRAIGEALGTTEDTVKTSLFRATRKLRAQLEGIR